MSVQIIPQPNKIKMYQQSFIIGPNSAICYQGESYAGEFLCDLLGLAHKKTGDINLVIDDTIRHEEGYFLKISEDGIMIRAKTDQGLFYGVQSLRQLLPASIEQNGICSEIQVAQAEVDDEPRFRYRGFMLDSVRHFFSVETILGLIDLLALHKLNKFHWHLSDDQGFRIDIEKFPKLSEISSKRKETQCKGFVLPWTKRLDHTPYFGIYTKEQIRQVVAYAKKRYIDVIPEIDMPGHFLAALAAYPEFSCTGGPFEVRTGWGISKDVLCVGKPQSLQFVKEILREVIELFPYKHIHIGGDETPYDRWKKCPDCQRLRAAQGFQKNSELQRYFASEIVSFLKNEGCEVVAWDEILKEGTFPEVTIQNWSLTGGKRIIRGIKEGQKCIVSNATKYYLDYPFHVFPLRSTYTFNPELEGLSKPDAQNILGIEAPLWTEAVDSALRIHWQMFPRLTAVSESAWTLEENKSFESFLTRLEYMNKRYDALGVNYAAKASYRYDGKPRILKVFLAPDHVATLEYQKYYMTKE
ncbi:Beta-hexosaminidase [bioreactor metagenome]|uniref:beta-N-acetylhexosaminidase n=1 Tax=bioreactor metagenome TaxID=1076179 RepID=A0A644WT16_9ZZZZ